MSFRMIASRVDQSSFANRAFRLFSRRGSQMPATAARCTNGCGQLRPVLITATHAAQRTPSVHVPRVGR